MTATLIYSKSIKLHSYVSYVIVFDNLFSTWPQSTVTGSYQGSQALPIVPVYGRHAYFGAPCRYMYTAVVHQTLWLLSK